MLGRELLKIVRPPGRRLVSNQQRSVKTHNEMVEKQFLLHRIPERVDAIDKLSRICGTPTPPWLRSMAIKLYQQMDEIRVHTEKKCWKFLTPAAEYSPVAQRWYDRIHAYMDLLRLKKGKHKYTNKGNVRRNARRRGIKNSSNLTLEEIQDALRYCRIRATTSGSKPEASGKLNSGIL